MQFKTKLGLVDIPNAEILAAADTIRGPVKECRACEVYGDGPCSKGAFEAMQYHVAQAIHAEHNRHEGQDTPWLALHKFQREKYRSKAYAALKALGIGTK